MGLARSSQIKKHSSYDDNNKPKTPTTINKELVQNIGIDAPLIRYNKIERQNKTSRIKIKFPLTITKDQQSKKNVKWLWRLRYLTFEIQETRKIAT